MGVRLGDALRGSLLVVEVEGKTYPSEPIQGRNWKLNGRDREQGVEPRQLRKQGDNLHLHQVYIPVATRFGCSVLFLLKTPFFFFFSWLSLRIG